MRLVSLLVLCMACAALAQFNFFTSPGTRNRNRGRNQQRQRVRGQRTRQQQTRSNFVNSRSDDALGDSEYHYSWRHDGGRSYTGGGASSYCSGLGNGWRGISINSPRENQFVSDVVRGERLDYIWTSGSRNGASWRWGDGNGLNIADWSHTGGSRRSQPDNREGNEFCLAILNNFYNDGVKWHDVACSHRKPIICERKRT